MSKIFISYRRDDSKNVTENIYRFLGDRFGRGNIFLDVTPGSIPYGSDFRQVLEQRVQQCKVVLVIIGPDWLDMRQSSDHDARRLDSADDFVRMRWKPR